MTTAPSTKTRAAKHARDLDAAAHLWFGVGRLLLLASGIFLGATSEIVFARPDSLKADPSRAAIATGGNADSLRRWHEMLASEPHVAGTPGDAKVIAALEKAFKDMGLEVERHPFFAYLAEPVDATLEVIPKGEPPIAINLREASVAGDSSPDHPATSFAWNAYSASGDVTGEVVYANYATREDFAELARRNVDISGKVVLARYGKIYRGNKAKFAQEAGAAALVMFTAPADSGYVKGPMYPQGGWANECCVQRGSVAALDYPGDPLTPGVEASEDAARLNPADVALPKIPVQPISWKGALEIVSRMRGETVPDGWQSGLPANDALTGGPDLRVRVMVKQDRRIVRSENVIATLRGNDEPDTKVILGCHHDAWVNGASDPLAGTICLLEAARVLSERASAGERPRRSIVFAAWGAEEFNIVGSTEWVESRAAELTRNCVAYVNLDMAAMGPQFGASASATLSRAILAAAADVPQARDPARTVLMDWTARVQKDGAERAPRVGSMGGGSDHVGFLYHCGIPSAGLGAGGSSGWSYHSAYDSLPWYWKVVGADYEPALMITRMTSTLAWGLASPRVLHVEPWKAVGEIKDALPEIIERGVAKKLWTKPDANVMPDALRALVDAIAAFEADPVAAHVRDAIASGDPPRWTDPRDLNRTLMDANQVWNDENAIVGRPWHRYSLGGTDDLTGYGSWAIPTLRWGVERGSMQEINDAVAMYVKKIARLRELLHPPLADAPAK